MHLPRYQLIKGGKTATHGKHRLWFKKCNAPAAANRNASRRFTAIASRSLFMYKYGHLVSVSSAEVLSYTSRRPALESHTNPQLWLGERRPR